jgi:uncharacterized RDD family membrane protein YckC
MRVRVAGFWRRLASGIVDALVLFSVFALLATLVAVILRHPLPRVGQIGPDYVVDMAVNGGVLAEAGLAMIGILGFLYFFLFTALRGQTFGKHLMRLKVIDAFGERPSMARALVRTLAYIPSLALLGLGFLWIGFDREKRGLHDWLADTYVVKS